MKANNLCINLVWIINPGIQRLSLLQLLKLITFDMLLWRVILIYKVGKQLNFLIFIFFIKCPCFILLNFYVVILAFLYCLQFLAKVVAAPLLQSILRPIVTIPSLFVTVKTTYTLPSPGYPLCILLKFTRKHGMPANLP